MSLTTKSLERFAQAYREKCLTHRSVGSLYNKFRFKYGYHNQVGLLFHDVRQITPDFIKAVRRLPRELTEQRDFRMSRALHLAAARSILPRDEWLKYEDDIPYLKPYMDIIAQENEDRTSWDYFIDAEDYDHETDKL